MVHCFYSTDDISWQVPGTKDHVIIHSLTEDGQKNNKTIQQIRYIMMSLREAHNKFKEHFPTIKVS